MKKALVTIGIFTIGFLGWLLYERPEPPFSAKPTPTPVVSEEPTYFAEIDSGGTVLRVIVADQKFIDSGVVGDPKNWVQTDVGGKIRKNYAGEGYTYDKDQDVFIPPKPSAGYILDKQTYQWILKR